MKHPSYPIFQYILVACALCATPAATLAQPDRAAPPTPPPSFIPTMPPGLKVPPPPPAPSANLPQAPVRQTDNRGNEVATTGSPLVREEDPRMREVVGLIRIPDMGTNEVLEMLENFTGKPILRQQSLPAVKITFYSQGALTRGEAISAIESLLSLNGIAITEVGEKFLKAVPAAVVNAQVAPRWEGSTLDAPPTLKLYEKIYKLDFLTTAEAIALIQPLMSMGAPIAFEKSGLLLITDTLVNHQRLERLLKIIDAPSAPRSEILVFQLENIAVTELVRRLDQITKGPLRLQLENNTTFDADERSNQLIAFTHPGNKELLENLIRKMDVSVAPLTRTEVFQIRYADAVQLVEIIDQVVTGQKQARDQQGASEAATTAQQTIAARRRAAQIQQQNQSAAQARADTENLQFSNFLTLVPDERANTIVASGTTSDLEYLKKLIDEIDTILAQVRIEVIITEVRLSENQTRGIDSFNFTYNVATGSGSADANTPTAPGFGPAGGSQRFASTNNFYGVSIPGVTWGPDGFGIEAVINAAESNSDVRVLSAPTIVTTHNKEAVISIGEERPVITSVVSDITATSTTRETVQFKDIKLELKVTPLIGSDDTVQMEIDQLVQGVIGTVVVSGNDQPIVGTRQATSYVSVRDRELIVLGGLQRTDFTQGQGRMAILGYIPIIGDLFTRNTNEEIRTELMIFIRPTILRNTARATSEAMQTLEKAQGRQEIESYLQDGRFLGGDRDEADAPSGTGTDSRPPKFR